MDNDIKIEKDKWCEKIISEILKQNNKILDMNIFLIEVLKKPVTTYTIKQADIIKRR